MKDYEINSLITAHLGWIHVSEPTGIDDGCGKWVYHKGRNNIARMPNYCLDLNKMAEAEATLSKEQQPIYFRHLCPNERDWLDRHAWPILCFATPRQRAEAFLKTVNKWRD